jgi:hypothetical protein
MTEQQHSPTTTAPTDDEWEQHRRWAVPPVGTRRQMWVQREAQAIFTARTGRADPWPSLEDYKAANALVPRDDED